MPRYYKNDDYRHGERYEAMLIQRLKDNGFTVTPSSKQENIELDIDCYVGDTPVSIKTQHMAQVSGKILLELYVKTIVQRLTPHSTNVNDYIFRWEPSWFFKGKADIYLFDVGNRILLVHKNKLVEAIEDDTIQSFRVNGNRPETVEKQLRMGHSHADARSMLLLVDELVEKGVAQVLYSEPTEPYTPQGLE